MFCDLSCNQVGAKRILDRSTTKQMLRYLSGVPVSEKN